MTDSTDGPEQPDAESAVRRRRGTGTTQESLGKRRGRGAHTVAKVIAVTLVTLGLVTAGGVVVAYNNWNARIDHQDVAAQLHHRPKKKTEGPKEPLNILVMGSDSRAGENNIDGLTGDGERSDTTILLHVSADRTFAYGISIPRDTLVDRPTCYEEDGTTEIPGAEDAMWNDAFAVGGAACTIQQLEQVSGIRVDNYMVVDFQGFKDMVNALDGVEVCIPEDIDDPEHGITLEAGTREIKGDEALSYVRVRHVGDGTDPQRIRRQQAFMAAMINKAVSRGMLVRPDRMNSFLNAVTDSITTDYENLAEIASLAFGIRGIGLDNIKFVTTPWVYSTSHPGRVEWTPEVDKLWKLVRNDKPLTDEFTEESISAADDVEGGSTTNESTGSGDPSDEGAGGGGKKKGEKAGSGLSEEARQTAGLC